MNNQIVKELLNNLSKTIETFTNKSEISNCFIYKTFLVGCRNGEEYDSTYRSCRPCFQEFYSYNKQNISKSYLENE